MMSPMQHRLTADEWRADINRRRMPGLASVDASALDPLWRRFRSLSAQVREQRKAGWIDPPEFLPLRIRSDETLELTLIVQQELSLYDERGAAVVPLDMLERILADVEALLTEIESQIGLIDTTFWAAELLSPVFHSLGTAKTFPTGAWQTAIEHFSAILPPRELTALIPLPELLLDRLLAARGVPQPEWIYAGIVRARWIAALRDVVPPATFSPREPLIAAALFADCGLAAQRTPPNAETTAYRRHPEISAALISLIGHASPLTAVLAGAHHERLDGSGFPHRWKDRELTPLMRHFTAVVRWTELLLEIRSAASVNEVLLSAATALGRETMRGLFDAASVTALLKAVQPDLPAIALPAANQGTRLSRHAAQPQSGPHQTQPSTVRMRPLNSETAATPPHLPVPRRA